MVGRNLMVHVSDSLLVCVPDQIGLLNPLLAHGIALNDFYVRDSVKLGSLHAHAACLPWGGTGARGAIVFQTIVEDFPYVTNYVAPKRGDEDAVVWAYAASPELRERSAALIAAFTEALRGRAQVVPLHAPGSLNLAHACGTCRFGNDSRTSVLDRDNRVHDLDNLYVVDASCLASSGGIHPSLTVVANSLRASDRIARR